MNRDEMLTRAAERREPWDVVVIGGGATGAGVAVDAADARLLRPAPRARRLRLRHVQPQHEARSRRRALSATGTRRAGLGSAPRARAAATERPAPRPRLRLRPSVLPPMGCLLLRSWDEGLRPARDARAVSLRPLDHDPFARSRSPIADCSNRRLARRSRLPRRPVRRLAAADSPRDDGRGARRGRTELCRSHRPHARCRRRDRWRSRPRPRRWNRVPRRGAGRGERGRAVLRRGAPPGRPARRADGRREPGKPRRPRSLVPCRATRRS